MKLLVIGSGGREHALAWKLHESQRMEELYCAPGNAGIAQEAECLPVDVSQPKAILQLAKQLRADLTIVGPEAPLVAGVVDEFEREGLSIIGPSHRGRCPPNNRGPTRGYARRGSVPKRWQPKPLDLAGRKSGNRNSRPSQPRGGSIASPLRSWLEPLRAVRGLFPAGAA